MTAILPVNTGTHAVTTVISQLIADAPELLAVLFGMTAIGYVIHLLSSWIKSGGFDGTGRGGIGQVHFDNGDMARLRNAVNSGELTNDEAEEIVDDWRGDS